MDTWVVAISLPIVAIIAYGSRAEQPQAQNIVIIVTLKVDECQVVD